MNEKYKDFYDLAINFIIDNDISCGETIYQTDRVMGNAYEYFEEMLMLAEKYNALEETE